MPDFNRRIVFCLLMGGLLIGSACGGSDTGLQKGVEETTTTSAPDMTSTTASTAKASTTTTARATTTSEAPTPTTAKPVSSGLSFANCTEAKAAGYKNIQRGAPGYSEDLDRDGDGLACES